MSQYRTGTVAVTNASASVVGTGTAFLANVSVGSVFTIAGSGVPYVVGAVADDTHLTLSSNYAGSSASAQTYAITTSYTPTLGLPYTEQKDIDTATIWKRAMLMLDTLLARRALQVITAATYTLVDSDRDIIANRAGTVTLTLPAPASYLNRELWVRTQQAAGTAAVSASSNVVPLAGGAAGTAIVSGTGKWVRMISDGTNWNIMAAN